SYLESLKNEQTMVVRNEENKGFIKAVNQGIRYADADYICILNNDVVVTKGWLEETVRVLADSPDVGVANPSSNSSGQFPGRDGIHAYAEGLRKYAGTYQELYRCRGFAMVIKSSVTREVGFFDERYGQGYFDDTDYSKRVQKAGYKTVRAKGAYVYHLESRSFNKVKGVEQLFHNNEQMFNKQWGRYLHVGYAIRDFGTGGEAGEVSETINRIVRNGHQALIFASSRVRQKLVLVDHESIRFVPCPDFFYPASVLYKVLRRKKKKKIDILVCHGPRTYGTLKRFKGMAGCPVINDSVPKTVTDYVQTISFDVKNQ
ncbi:MAG: glycosyltransferase, partial [Candidatus Omnitrophica bacterium]|nr:glycosyltransferase [Candidatus Omnitrophota bacterium]